MMLAAAVSAGVLHSLAGAVSAGELQDASIVAAVRSAAMETCYPMVGGGDIRAADRSIAARALASGPPPAFPTETLDSLLNTPGGRGETYHVPTDTGMVLVVTHEGSMSCTIALLNGSGEAASEEIDSWFNGEPSPFALIDDTDGPGGSTRVYEGGEAESRLTRIQVTTVKDGYRQDVPIRFLATMYRVSN